MGMAMAMAMAMAPLSTHHHVHHLIIIIITILSLSHHSLSQPTHQTNENYLHIGPALLSPSMVVVIVLLISAFLFLTIFYIYIRHCNATTTSAVASLQTRRPSQGLAAEIITSFPILLYADLGETQILNDYVECAVCLADFASDEKLRLLPRCSHVFHQDCIDAWLSGHVTCPVCRSDLAGDAAGDVETASTASIAVHRVSEVRDRVVIDFGGDDVEVRGSWRRTIGRLKRCHSTGHSVGRAPEVFDGRRSSSSGDEEGEEEGNGRGVWMVRSERWPAFFVRSLLRKGVEREGMVRERIGDLILPFECLGVGDGGGDRGVDFRSVDGTDVDRADEERGSVVPH